MTLTELQRAAMNQIDSGYKKIKRLMADPKISTEAVIITIELPVHFEDRYLDICIRLSFGMLISLCAWGSVLVLCCASYVL